MGVTGGNIGSTMISTTETLVDGDTSWVIQNLLPTFRHGLRGVSLHDTVIMTGGEDSFSLIDDVLVLDLKNSYWKFIGSMADGRAFHGASLLNLEDVYPYCK